MITKTKERRNDDMGSGYEALAAVILHQAVRDYNTINYANTCLNRDCGCQWITMLRPVKCTGCGGETIESRKGHPFRSRLEGFFESDWFETLCDHLAIDSEAFAATLKSMEG